MCAELCGCEQSQALLEALERAWAELACPTTTKERTADKIIGQALDANHASVLAYIESEG